MELFIVNMVRDDGSSDWRLYMTKGRASAALKLAMADGRPGDAVGGQIFSVNTSGLLLVEERGTVEVHVEGQQALF